MRTACEKKKAAPREKKRCMDVHHVGKGCYGCAPRAHVCIHAALQRRYETGVRCGAGNSPGPNCVSNFLRGPKMR